jgi:hypothetical protein
MTARQEFYLRVAVRRPVAAATGELGRAVLEDVARRCGIAFEVAVEVGDNSPGGVDEVRILHENIGLHARVDTGSGVVLEATVVDVTGAEAEGGKTRVDVGPIVMVVGDPELTLVLAGVAVGVADKRALPLSKPSQS